MKKQIIFVSLIVCILSSGAFAGRIWHYNPITNSGDAQIMNGNTSIAMRSGGVWPVVATREGVGCMLPGGWVKSIDGFTGLRLDGAAASDGIVAFADDKGCIMMLTSTGFKTASYSGRAMDTASVAFTGNNNLGVLHNSSTDLTMQLTMNYGSSWYTMNVGDAIQSDTYALDFDSMNQAHIAYVNSANQLGYAVKTVAGNWSVSDSMIPVSGRLDMVLTESDIPYAVYKDASQLRCAVYNPAIYDWQVSTLGINITTENFSAAYNNDGGVGVAFVSDNWLYFAEYSGGSWSTIEQLCEAYNDVRVGITYDYENFPVISYADSSQNLYIAYDPIPEPATLAILGLGAMLLRRRR